MKRLWIAIGMLAVVLVSSIFYVNYHGDKSEEMVMLLAEVSDSVLKGKLDEIPMKIEQLQEIWDKEHHHWDVLFGKNLTAPIIESLSQLDYTFKLEMYDELALEARRTITHIECIWEYQKILYTNLI